MRTAYEEDVTDIPGGEEQARIRRQLERILAHTSFRNSRRYQSFLRYVVEERLNGNAIYLKERMIGIAVFQQPRDYDTNSNSVVRVTAGEVRRRLAQYYLNADLADEIMIELPVGSYVPEFREHDSSTLPTETALTTPDATFLYSTAEAPQEIPVAITPAARPETSRLNMTLVAVVCCCLLAILAAVLFVPGDKNLTETDRLWKGAFNGRDVLLCAGPQGAEKQQYANTGISYTIVKTIGLVGSAIGHSGGSTFVLPMQDTKLEDLQRSPVVLLGAFNNEWTMRLQAPLRYQFVNVLPDSRGIVDTRNPTGKRFMLNDQPTRDYGLFAHFHSPATGQSIVIVGGLGTQGTAAVRIFLSSPELLKEFSRTAPRGWEKGNYEIVLSSDQVNRLADSPKVEAVHFW